MSTVLRLKNTGLDQSGSPLELRWGQDLQTAWQLHAGRMKWMLRGQCDTFHWWTDEPLGGKWTCVLTWVRHSWDLPEILGVQMVRCQILVQCGPEKSGLLSIGWLHLFPEASEGLASPGYTIVGFWNKTWRPGYHYLLELGGRSRDEVWGRAGAVEVGSFRTGGLQAQPEMAISSQRW